MTWPNLYAFTKNCKRSIANCVGLKGLDRIGRTGTTSQFISRVSLRQAEPNVSGVVGEKAARLSNGLNEVVPGV